MARTPSVMIPLGSKLPAFQLNDVISGNQFTEKSYEGAAALVICFICNHCPFVIHIQEALVDLAKEYLKKNVAFLAISANDAETYPQDGPELMTVHAQKYHFPFPYLYDETQEVANAFDAACTPDFFVYSPDHSLVYRGQLDDSRPGNGIPVSGEDLRHALDCLLEGKKNTRLQRPSIGCNIKWKK